MTLSDLERYYDTRVRQCYFMRSAMNIHAAGMNARHVYGALFEWAEAMHEADELEVALGMRGLAIEFDSVGMRLLLQSRGVT